MELNDREVYVTDGEYIISPVIDADREHYVELHKELYGEKTLYLNPMCKDIIWEATIHGHDKVYSIFDKNGEYCGSIEVQNPNTQIPELGIDLLTCKRNQGITPKIIKMFARQTYEISDVEYFLVRISSKNTHSKHVFEKLGAIRIGEEDEGCEEVVYRYRLGPEELVKC